MNKNTQNARSKASARGKKPDKKTARAKRKTSARGQKTQALLAFICRAKRTKKPLRNKENGGTRDHLILLETIPTKNSRKIEVLEMFTIYTLTKREKRCTMGTKRTEVEKWSIISNGRTTTESR